jgi:glycerol-3-phosphate dehydrogenase
MRYRKEIQTEKVKQCIFLIMEKCDFGNELCWFNHDKASKNSFKETTDLNCKVCNKSFKIRSEFMTHRKLAHSEIVPTCKNNSNGSCEYVNCWFKHTISVTDNASGAQNITDENITET